MRFIADNRTKNFFVSYFLLLHEFFVNELKRRGLLELIRQDQCFMGQGWVEMSHIEFDDFSYDWGQPPDAEMQKFKWTQKYFTKDSIKRLWK